MLSGPANRAELREAVAAVQRGPLDEDALIAMRSYGDLVRGTAGHPLWGEPRPPPLTGQEATTGDRASPSTY